MIKNGTTCFNDPGGLPRRRAGPGRGRQQHPRDRQPLDARHRAARQAGAGESCSIRSTTISATARRWCASGTAPGRRPHPRLVRPALRVQHQRRAGARRRRARPPPRRRHPRPRRRGQGRERAGAGRSSASARWSATTTSDCSAPTSISCTWAIPTHARWHGSKSTTSRSRIVRTAADGRRLGRDRQQDDPPT